MSDKKTKHVRGTGRTTGLVLQAFSRASLDPTIWVTFRDHCHTEPKFLESFIGQMVYMANQMGLEYDFRIKDGSIQLRYPVRRIVAARQQHREQNVPPKQGGEA